MDVNGGRAPCNNQQSQSDSDEETLADLRRGPWTVEEDLTLINYIASHGEGRWNSLARCAGLKRTGKSCRLRWLNYLRPDVRRGNITLEEQLLILELHSRWGNRWSKIAQYLPGRTDNEIKNYWRTRVQKHAKQLKCDVNSKEFKDAMKYLWMPRLAERIQATSGGASTSGAISLAVASPEGSTVTTNTTINGGGCTHYGGLENNMESMGSCYGGAIEMNSGSTGSSADLVGAQVADMADYQSFPIENPNLGYFPSTQGTEPLPSYYGGLDFQAMDQSNDNRWMDSEDTSCNLWNVEDINWYFNNNV